MNEKLEAWLKEARRYAYHRYCYEEMLDDFKEQAIVAAETGQDPYDWVEYTGEKYDLQRCDTDWGIHDGVPFLKQQGVVL